MGRIANFWKYFFYSKPFEVAKGRLKGQYIRLTARERYRELVAARPAYRELSAENKKVIRLVKKGLGAEGIFPLKVFGRVKTIGSFDRKLRYAKAKYSGARANAYLGRDFIGVTVIVKSQSEYEKVVSALGKIGSFSQFGFHSNPHYYLVDKENVFKNVDRPPPPESAGETYCVAADMSFPGVSPVVSLRIVTNEVNRAFKSTRGKYKRKIYSVIKEHEKSGKN